MARQGALAPIWVLAAVVVVRIQKSLTPTRQLPQGKQYIPISALQARARPLPAPLAELVAIHGLIAHLMQHQPQPLMGFWPKVAPVQPPAHRRLVARRRLALAPLNIREGHPAQVAAGAAAVAAEALGVIAGMAVLAAALVAALAAAVALARARQALQAGPVQPDLPHLAVMVATMPPASVRGQALRLLARLVQMAAVAAAQAPAVIRPRTPVALAVLALIGRKPAIAPLVALAVLVPVAHTAHQRAAQAVMLAHMEAAGADLVLAALHLVMAVAAPKASSF